MGLGTALQHDLPLQPVCGLGGFQRRESCCPRPVPAYLYIPSGVTAAETKSLRALTVKDKTEGDDTIDRLLLGVTHMQGSSGARRLGGTSVRSVCCRPRTGSWGSGPGVCPVVPLSLHLTVGVLRCEEWVAVLIHGSLSLLGARGRYS